MSSLEAHKWYTVPSISREPKREVLCRGGRKKTTSVLNRQRPSTTPETVKEPQESAYELLNADDRSIVNELLEKLEIVPSGKEVDLIRIVLSGHPQYQDWTRVGYKPGKGYIHPPELDKLISVVKKAWSAERREGDAMRPPGEYVPGKPRFNSDQRQEMLAQFFAEKKAA